MDFPSRLLTRSFLVGVLVVSTAYGASALTVKRTNQLVDGAFVPVLIVRTNGETHVHLIGEDGLTRAILFNRQKALDWAKEKYGAESAQTESDGTSDGGGFGFDGAGGDDDDDGGY